MKIINIPVGSVADPVGAGKQQFDPVDSVKATHREHWPNHVHATATKRQLPFPNTISDTENGEPNQYAMLAQ